MFFGRYNIWGGVWGGRSMEEGWGLEKFLVIYIEMGRFLKMVEIRYINIERL